MTGFDWLKGLQTGMVLTALVLVLTCATALVRRGRDRPLPDGYVITCGVFMMALASLWGYGYQILQYLLQSVDAPVTTPLPVRLVTAVLYLSGGSLFVGVTQQAHFGIEQTLIVWSALVAMIVLVVAFGSAA